MYQVAQGVPVEEGFLFPTDAKYLIVWTPDLRLSTFYAASYSEAAPLRQGNQQHILAGCLPDHQHFPHGGGFAIPFGQIDTNTLKLNTEGMLTIGGGPNLPFTLCGYLT